MLRRLTFKISSEFCTFTCNENVKEKLVFTMKYICVVLLIWGKKKDKKKDSHTQRKEIICTAV